MFLLCSSLHVLMLVLFLQPLQLDEDFFDLQLSIPEPVKKSTANRRKQRVTPVSDMSGSNTKPYNPAVTSDSERSGINYFDDSRGSDMNVMTSPKLKLYSEEEHILPSHVDVNPYDFTSLQNYLESKGMESSPINLTELSAKEDLERSLKDFISIDVLTEDNLFQCDTCKTRATSKIFCTVEPLNNGHFKTSQSYR